MGVEGWREGERESTLTEPMGGLALSSQEQVTGWPVILIQIRPGSLSLRLQNIRFITHSSQDVLPRFQDKIYYIGWLLK